MKQKMSLIVGAVAMLGVCPAMAATNFGPRAASSVDLSGMPAERIRTNVNYQKYETRTTSKVYQTKDAGNLYYTQPVKRSELYKQYDNGMGVRNVRSSRSETVRSEMKRKYFLAHPFFQPLKGKFGSVTDLSYTDGGYKFELNPNPISGSVPNDTKAEWDTKLFTIKEDFSYGITDQIAVIGMAQYDITKLKLDWSVDPDDKKDDKDLDIWGLGAQWRFVDTADWIATASAYYQRQKDTSNNFVLDLKAGYKVASTTIYGLIRGWSLWLDDSGYGIGIEGTTESGETNGIVLPYKVDTDSIFFAEGGIGMFSVLDEDWTLNLEAIIGHYDWHNQASISGAIGWQPNDWFALNLYAKTSVYDSADGKHLDYYIYDNTAVLSSGKAKLSDNRETTIGVQAIFMF